MAKKPHDKYKIVGFLALILIILGIYTSIEAYSDNAKNYRSIESFAGYLSINDMLSEVRKEEIDKEIESINEPQEKIEEEKIEEEIVKDAIDKELEQEAPKVPIIKKSNGNKKVVGYYASWAAYSGFTPDKIDANKLTHINYAFANIGSDLKITLGDANIDASNLSKLNGLKNKNKNLKILISVGGWTWSDKFSDVALTESSRALFADSVVDFIVNYGIDGVDLDWEYPVSGGLAKNTKRPEDKENFTLLLKAIREKLNLQGDKDGKYYLLTFSGGTSKLYVNNIELSKISQYVDFGNIMTYDIHGNWDKYTDFNAPLYNTSSTSPHNKWSVDSAVNTWLNAGFPADKLVMGVPFYGYKYEGVQNSNNGFLQTYSKGSSITYSEIRAKYINAAGFKRHFNSEAKVPWLYNGSVFISYDDEESMTMKAQYIHDKGLGGAMIWELSQDPDRVLLNVLYNGLN